MFLGEKKETNLKKNDQKNIIYIAPVKMIAIGSTASCTLNDI